MRLKRKLRKFTRWFREPPGKGQRGAVINAPSARRGREGSRLSLRPTLRLVLGKAC